MLLSGRYYYNFKNDELKIVFNDNKITSEDKKGDITFYYSDKELIQISFFNISPIIKIKSKGRIFLPPAPLINLLNYMLKPIGDYQLAEINHSGYVIGKVIEKSGEEYLINIKKSIITIKCDKDIALDSYVVIYDNQICSNEMLEIDENKDQIFYLISDKNLDYLVGKDFFTIEEEKNLN